MNQHLRRLNPAIEYTFCAILSIAAFILPDPPLLPFSRLFESPCGEVVIITQLKMIIAFVCPDQLPITECLNLLQYTRRRLSTC